MVKITQAGVGSVSVSDSLQDAAGSLMPIQAHSSDGATTFRVLGRVAKDAPFVEIIAPGTADFLQSISWVPEIELEVTSGTGTVTLWVGEL